MFAKWLVRASRFQLIAAACAFAIVVWLVDTGLDSLMIRYDSSRRELLFISGALTAALAGGLMLWVLMVQRTREAETQQRMQVIADMNHHVRNALQVISCWGFLESDREHLSGIREAVDRIHWALRDVLPRGVPEDRLATQPQPDINQPQAPRPRTTCASPRA